ncbi:MAB_1171c family putative transporter [Streptomyces sp. NPDC057445]|uniref:MAB_1171c family putative transporter n=1 Tax=Streptomyces sp. NPDC057445 TaxID=3346136 RepID=UPI003676A3AA
MSEGLSNVVYLIIAVMSLSIAIWKALAFRRDSTLTLGLTTSLFLCSAVVYVLASPWGYRVVGAFAGEPSFATLPVYVGILWCFAYTHALTILWNPRLRRGRLSLRGRLTVWTVAYGFAAVLMVVTFSMADLSTAADPLRFNTNNAQEPVVLVFLAVFLSTLTCGTLSTYRQCQRMRLPDQRLQHAVRAFGIAMLFVFGYVVCSVPAITLAAAGNHALDQVGVLGSSFGSTGALIASYGLSGGAASAWMRERRDIRALQPLWDLVVAGVDPELAFSATSARSHRLATNVTFNLHRRVIEILDGMRALRPWVTAQAPQAVYALAAAPQPTRSAYVEVRSEQELQAIATAAALRDAAEHLQASRREGGMQNVSGRPQTPHGQGGVLPGEDTAAADERERLLRVARALTHPLVSAALQEVRRTRTPAEA